MSIPFMSCPPICFPASSNRVDELTIYDCQEMYDSASRSHEEWCKDVNFSFHRNRVEAIVFDVLITEAMAKRESEDHPAVNPLMDLLIHLGGLAWPLGHQEAIVLLDQELNQKEKHLLLKVIQPELKLLREEDPDYDMVWIFEKLQRTFWTYDISKKSYKEFVDDLQSLPYRHNRVQALLMHYLELASFTAYKVADHPRTNTLMGLLFHLRDLDWGVGVEDAIHIMKQELNEEERQLLLTVTSPILDGLRQNNPDYDARWILERISKVF